MKIPARILENGSIRYRCPGFRALVKFAAAWRIQRRTWRFLM